MNDEANNSGHRALVDRLDGDIKRVKHLLVNIWEAKAMDWDEYQNRIKKAIDEMAKETWAAPLAGSTVLTGRDLS